MYPRGPIFVLDDVCHLKSNEKEMQRVVVIASSPLNYVGASVVYGMLSAYLSSKARKINE